MSISQWGKDNLDYLGVPELYHFIQQHLIAQTQPSHSEKPLETKEIWVSHFCIRLRHFQQLVTEKSETSLWAKPIILFEIKTQNIWCIPVHIN